MSKSIKNTFKSLAFVTGLTSLVLSNNGCGSCDNSLNDLSRDFNKKDYHITLYDCQGKPIMDEILKNTFIDISENGSGLRYLKDGKLVVLNGTYILKEISKE